MARKVLVRLVDDLDGQPGEDVSTVTFALDRVNYEIDLNAENATTLREALADYVAVARRTGGRIKRGAASGRSAARSGDAAAIREWARGQGHELGERGRIPSHIVEAFRAAGGNNARLKTAAAAKASTSRATVKAVKAVKPAKAAGPAKRGKNNAKPAAKAGARGKRG
ncbi:MAG TPA: Lsr2 family protein [Pseudonocardiaceae bacterium]|jgi:hypothetical protein|nr:Lsr2 family protein [Pseudonocardiaceae bacterium]